MPLKTSSYILALFSITAGVSLAHPLASPAPAQLADCLYDKDHSLVQGNSNFIATADIEGCMKSLNSRGLPRIDPGPLGYTTDELISKRGIKALPLVVPGEEIAAKQFPTRDLPRIDPSLGYIEAEVISKRNAIAFPSIVSGGKAAVKLNKRDIEARALPPVGFFDETSETPNKPQILTNFVETGTFDRDWSKPICERVTKIDPKQTSQSGMFNYNVQGTHKKLLSLVHDKKFVHVLVTFTPTDPETLPQYDLFDLCKNAMHQAAQSNHELKYGFMGSQTVYSMINNHKITIQPKQTAQQAHKRSEFGGPIGLINIQFGDHAQGVEMFNGNGLPV